MSAPDVAAPVVTPVAVTRRASAARVARFTTVERIAHWVNAVLFAVTILTGLMFRFGWGQSLITDRLLARNIHVFSGLGIVVAFAIAVVPRWGRALRRDLSRVNRWSPDDVRWIRSRGRDATVKLGKFNPGQKLNVIFVAAAAVILAATGAMMKWNEPFSTDLRNGATFVHDWFAYAIFAVVFGHIVMALKDRESIRGITYGTVTAEWARHHRPAWYAEQRREAHAASGNTSSAPADTTEGPVPVDA